MKKSFFTPAEVTKFKKLYPVTMNTVLCKMFGLSESQLRSRAKYHGVRKTAELIKQAQSLARTGKKHNHHRRHQPEEETVEPETDGLCIHTAHGIKAHQGLMLIALGYDYATCTVCGSNAAQQRVLTRAGWVRIASFTSSKTGEEVEIWGWEVSSELT